MIARAPKVLRAIKELQFRAPFEHTNFVGIDDPEEYPYSPTQNSSTSSIDSPRSEQELRSSQEDDGPAVKGEATKDMEELSDREHGDYGLMKLEKKIIRLLSALPDNQLISFRWDMGTCFPDALLGEGGYLVTHQNCIRKLALITKNDFTGPPLEEFTNLREFSWKGLLSDDDCASLKAFLVLHHERLTSFEVDFVDWTEVEHRFDLPDDDEDDDDDDDDSTPLIDLIFPKRNDDYEGFLPNLQTLSLSAASFKGSWDRLIGALNLRNVKELRLLNCKRAVELLDYMAQTNVSLQVTRAEMILARSKSDRIDPKIIDFLAPFDSLEDFFLMFQSQYAEWCYADMVLHHRDTLRRLVYHRRHYCMAEEAPYWEEYCDSCLEETEDGGFADILRETKLETIGVCGEPSQLQKSFQSMACTVNSLKLLHLRFTGKVERKPKFFKESEAYSDPLSSEFLQAYGEAQDNGTTPPRRSGPTEAEFRIRWEQIQGENWRQDEEKELEAFADWAFGPDGFPCLQVLASGDFSYGNRFAGTQTLWCRNTCSSRSRKTRSRKTWRAVEESDIAEKELIDANMDMMSACPVSPLFYKYGSGHVFPGIS